MYIDTPQNVLALAAKTDGITSEGEHYLLKMKRDGSKFFFDNRLAMPTAKNYADVAKHLTEITEVHFGAAQAESLLLLYPHVRIKVAVYDGIGDTDVRDGIAFAAAHFFLGCTWPTYGDKVNVDVFVSMLKKQATQMGFKTATVTA